MSQLVIVGAGLATTSTLHKLTQEGKINKDISLELFEQQSVLVVVYHIALSTIFHLIP